MTIGSASPVNGSPLESGSLESEGYGEFVNGIDELHLKMIEEMAQLEVIKNDT